MSIYYTYDFPDGTFTLKFHPAKALITALEEMMKFNTQALLTVRERNNFQIKAYYTPNAVFSLDIEADLLSVTFNPAAYCLRFTLLDWYERIKNHVNENPHSSLSIKKFHGSHVVHCLFGKDTGFTPLIELGEAKFVKRIPTYPIEPFSYVKVTMEGVWFRAFIQNFSSLHDNDDSDVQLRITPYTLTWITSRRSFEYPVEMYVKEVDFQAGLYSFQFRVYWDKKIFDILCSASAASCCEGVELTVFDNCIKERFYRFRFLYSAKSYNISYEVKVV